MTVHFNPASLQYTVSNTLKDQGSGSKKKQYVSQTTAKLTMDLVFDTTDTGEDVRETTDKMAKLLKPHGPSGKQVPPLVEFGWGVYRFTGMVEQYKETLDFFAAGGVPLRAGVNLTLSQPGASSSRATRTRSHGRRRSHAGAGDGADLHRSGGRTGRRRQLARRSARRARDRRRPTARRACASPAAAELAVGVGAGVSLGAAAAFSAGASAGFGVGVSGGVGPGHLGRRRRGRLGGRRRRRVGRRIGGIRRGGRRERGASADRRECRRGLRRVGSAREPRPAPTSPACARGCRRAVSMPIAERRAGARRAGAGAGGGVQFGLGGRAQSSGSASLSADVGANAELTGAARIRSSWSDMPIVVRGSRRARSSPSAGRRQAEAGGESSPDRQGRR